MAIKKMYEVKVYGATTIQTNVFATKKAAQQYVSLNRAQGKQVSTIKAI